MRIKLKRSVYEYEAVIQLLNIAINDFGNYNDEFLRIIVRDAKLLASDNKLHIYKVDRRVLKFSMTLSALENSKLMALDANNLAREDYQQIYNFFKRRK